MLLRQPAERQGDADRPDCRSSLGGKPNAESGETVNGLDAL
jgi:hypothetical protein